MAFLALQPDVGLQCIFLCGARTAAPHKLFRTQFRTHLNFWVIAPALALALFSIIFLYISYFCTILLIITQKRFSNVYVLNQEMTF